MGLKTLLGEELFNQLTKKLGDKKVAIISDGNWMPKEKFNEVNEEKKQYKEQVIQLNTQLEGLKKQLKDNEEANTIIDKLKQQIEDKEKELTKTRKNNAIKLEILKADPNDVADILPHIKSDLVTVSDAGEIVGLSDQLKTLKENKPYLFKENDPDGTGGSKGNKSKGNKGRRKNPWLAKTFNLTEQGKIYREDPELAAKLMEQANESNEDDD